MALTKWQPLSLRHEVRDSGHVVWLELFFDLIYVAALIQLGDKLSEDVSWGGIAEFAGAFVVLWWTWTGTTAFMNRFAVDDLVHRALTFVQMFAVGNFAIIAVAPIEDRSQWLAIAYVGARIPLLVMYFRARLMFPSSAPITDLYLACFTAGGLAWLVSLAAPEPARYWIWAGALVIEFIAPLAAANRSGAPPTHEEHFRERYALFTIIVLGETLVKTITKLTEIGLTVRTEVFGGLSALILVALWWTYFDDVAESYIRRRSVFSNSSVTNRIIWVYAHLPLTAGLTAFGVASKKVVAVENFGDMIRQSYSWLLAGSLIAVLLAVTVLDLLTASPHHGVDSKERVGPRVTAAVTVGIIGLALATEVVNAATGVVLIALAVTAQIAAEVIIAAKRERNVTTRMHEELQQQRGSCTHIGNAREEFHPSELECDHCREGDETWVQLRICLTCGEVACCDDSNGQHATAHHRETGHPVIATLEPGDSWAYCYIHQVTDYDWRAST